MLIIKSMEEKKVEPIETPTEAPVEPVVEPTVVPE